ncbi:PH domain-containing protein [Bacillus kexueae]|uniref:PH domain-containing protein n=1 Tax=Aeribacillus kexueae TaxID=2078952 RepID=UPI001FB01D63|nr:PH domain-containing protein [Bacillus kexueae]
MRPYPTHALSRKALNVFRLNAILNAFFVLVFLVAGALFSYFILEVPNWVLWIAGGGYILYWIVSVMYVPSVKYRMWRYEVREHEVELQYGVFVVKRVLVPMIRVQHVDTSEGPILRKYKLANVTIATAATVHEIPALDVEKADQLRDYISQLAREAKEDV